MRLISCSTVHFDESVLLVLRRTFFLFHFMVLTCSLMFAGSRSRGHAVDKNAVCDMIRLLSGLVFKLRDEIVRIREVLHKHPARR